MSKPTIIMPEYGRHNADIEGARSRLLHGGTYKDLSTICIVPIPSLEIETIGGKEATWHVSGIDPLVLQSWFSLMPPMNQKFIRMFPRGYEVADAYNATIEMILANPELSKWKYILTLEWDNMPPPDGLIKLYEAMEMGYDVVSGLYWTKGEGGQPMIYGNPSEMPLNFIPQIPVPDTVQPCRGLGMGFTLFKLKIFKDERIPRPWFRTIQDFTPNVGARSYTQDLWFFQHAGAFYKFACDNRVRVGHYSPTDGLVW